MRSLGDEDGASPLHGSTGLDEHGRRCLCAGLRHLSLQERDRNSAPEAPEAWRLPGRSVSNVIAEDAPELFTRRQTH